MLDAVLNRLDRSLGIGCVTPYERALLGERYEALKRQLPWLYGILSANLLGVFIATRSDPAVAAWPNIAFLGVVAVRSLLWLRVARLKRSPEQMKRDMRNTFLIACIFFAASGVWSLYLYLASTVLAGSDIAIVAALAAIGGSWGLSSFPQVARVPLVVLALPSAILTAVTPGAANAGMGLGLITMTLLNLRLIRVNGRIFSRLVSSRFTVDAEKKRALSAEQRALHEQSRAFRLAHTDPLTGATNRRGFLSAVEAMDEHLRRRLALIMLDLDGFKPINDTFGHASGDAILVEVGRRLSAIAGHLPVARLGGDEFALVCECDAEAEAITFAERAVESLSAPFWLEDRRMRISASAGVSFQQEDKLADALRRADIALHHAKQSVRGAVALFSSEMEFEVQRKTAIEQALREPGLSAEISLRFQPIFQLDSMELGAFEALARWQHPDLGWISPSEFIPITEQISVVQQISDDLLRRAAAEARNWPDSIRLSFNLSPVQLCSPDTARKLLAIVDEEGLDPRRLQMEVTETALLANFEVARCNLGQLRQRGVRTLIDDFGAGYSSISYLREMTFDGVKLDGSLISSAGSSEAGAKLLQGVLALCAAMGQQCVAEHVETQEQLEMLRRLECRHGQGFVLAPPLDREGAAELARSRVLRFPRPADYSAAARTESPRRRERPMAW